MRFKTALHLTSYGLQVTGVSTLYSSGEIGGGMLLGYLACLATTRFLPRIRLDGAVQGIVFGILLTLFVVDAVAFSPFIPATAHLLMLVSLVRLCSARTKRDYLLLLFISFAFRPDCIHRHHLRRISGLGPGVPFPGRAGAHIAGEQGTL